MDKLLDSDVFIPLILVLMALVCWGALGGECEGLLNTIIGGIIGWWGKGALNNGKESQG
jgi:hypothetical protein